MIPWAHPSPKLKQHLDRFSRFYTDDRRVSLYFTIRRPPSQKYRHFPWGIWTPSNTWFPGPTRVLNPNGISIGSAVFAGLASVTDGRTDGPTDRPRYSVGITTGHIYVRSTAMRPNNNQIYNAHSVEEISNWNIISVNQIPLFCH